MTCQCCRDSDRLTTPVLGRELCDECATCLRDRLQEVRDLRASQEHAPWKASYKAATERAVAAEAHREALEAEVRDLRANAKDANGSVLEAFSEIEIALYGKAGNTWELTQAKRIERALRRLYNGGQSAHREAQITALRICRETLELAQLWLANCVPTVHIEGRTPLPAIDAALKQLDALSVHPTTNER